jgi:hypothetical protein
MYLGMLKTKDIPKAHSACWIRDYKTGKRINTFTELVRKLEHDRYGLRISFFSFDSLNEIEELIKLARLAHLPNVSHESSIPFNLTAYTIFWYNKKPRLVQSNINYNPVAIAQLFKQIGTLYNDYYFSPDYKNYETCLEYEENGN